MRKLTVIGILFVVLLLTACNSGEVAPAVTSTESNIALTSPVLIGEVLAGMPGDNNYEFIELTNPSLEAPFDLKGAALWYQLSDDADEELAYRWADHALIAPGGTYLLGRADKEYSVPVDALIELPFVPQRGGLQLRAADGTVLDSLAWGNGPEAYRLTEAAPAMENGLALLRTGGTFTLSDAPGPQNAAWSGDLTLRLDFPETVNPGETFSYTLTVSNEGALAAEGLVVQVPVPSEFEILTLPADVELAEQASYFDMSTLAASHQVVLWRVNTLDAGASASVEIALKAPWTYLTVTTANYAVAAQDGALLAMGGAARTAVAGGTIPIGTARSLANEEIIVEGIVTMQTGGLYAGSGNTKFYMEDETGGLQVWIDDGEGDVNVQLGDRVRVRGLLLVYRGAMELAPAPEGVEVVGRGSELTAWPPLQVSVEDAATDLQNLPGRLIRAEGTVARVEEFTYSYEIDLVDEYGYLASVYVDKLTEISVEAIESGETYQITGIVEVTDQTQRVYPRLQADLAKVYPPVLQIDVDAPNTIEAGATFDVQLTVTNYTPAAVHDVQITAPLPRFDFSLESISDEGIRQDDAVVWMIPALEGLGESATVSYQAKIVTTEEFIRLEKAQVSAADGPEPAESQAHLIFLGEIVPVWAIQGDGTRSPYIFDRATTTGVVTGVFPELEGFWIQALEEDYDPLTSDGLYIHTGEMTVDVLPGDWAQVSGVVREAYQQTQLQVESPDDIVVLSSANSLPIPVELDPPVEQAAAEAYYEALEGMFVQVSGPAVAVAPTNRYGEYVLVRAEHGATRLWQGADNGIAIVVDDGSTTAHDDRSTLAYAVNSGDQVSNLIGPLAYTFGQYKVEPVTQPFILATEGTLPTLEPLAEDEFSLMSWNVENLFDFKDPHPSSPSMPAIAEYRIHVAKVANTILAAGAPTVVGLQEVENIEILEDVAAHEALAGYDYQAVLIEGTDSRYIDVGYLVRGDQAEILHQAQFPAPEGITSRPPLQVQVAVVTSQGTVTFSVLNNHFTSMSGGEEATEPRRNAQAAWNVAVMEGILAEDADGLLAVMGDLNSYYDALPIDTLREAGLAHVFEAISAEERYTYIYQGQSQVLDHILVTPGLMDMLRRVEILHLNADYALPIPGDESPLRKSDHDPVVAVFAIQP